jgi:hypothetical protein
MCNITEKINLKVFTGYKIVVTDKYGHYYSPHTGIRYKKGPVQKLPVKKGKYTAWYDYSDFTNWNSSVYNYKQCDSRLTAVLKFKHNAEMLLDNLFADSELFILPKDCKFNIIQMTVGGNLYRGTYGPCDIILGNIVKSIKLKK